MDSESQESKAVITRFVDEVLNQKKWDVFDEMHHPDFVNLSAPPGMPSDVQGGKMFLSGFLGAFPDSHFTIDDIVAEGDTVATKKTLTGTHREEFMGIPATGNRVRLQYADVMRVRDGKIVEHWLSMDQLSFIQQPGVIPA
jgi:predicted ester cyclase